MRDLSTAPSKPKGPQFSRLQALKLTLLAGSGLALGASPVLAENSTLASKHLSLITTGKETQNLPQAITAPTSGTSYLIFSGLDFKPLNSSTSYGYANYTGIFAIANADFFAATINLPQQAQITELEFYTVHNSGDTATFLLCNATPGNGGFGDSAGSTLTTTNSNTQTVPVSISGSLPKVDNTTSKYLLLWQPATSGSNETLFGARLGYTGGIGRFGA